MIHAFEDFNRVCSYRNIAVGVFRFQRRFCCFAVLSQALAAVEGEGFVTPDHVQRAAGYVIPHRLITRGVSPQSAVKEILSQVPVPTENVAESMCP